MALPIEPGVPRPGGTSKLTATRRHPVAKTVGLGASTTLKAAPTPRAAPKRRLLGTYLGTTAGLAPASPGSLSQTASEYVASHVNPYLQQIGSSFDASTKAGTGAIRAGTGSYSTALGAVAPRVQGIANEQAGQVGKETGALADFLAGAGGASFADVTSKLESAGIDPATAGPTGIGQGAGGIAAAHGFATGADVTTQGGNQAQFAALLPGFAMLSGQNAEQGFRSSQEAARNEALGNITSQIPGLASEIGSQLRGEEITKAQARQAFIDSQLGRQSSERLAQAGRDDALTRLRTSIKATKDRDTVAASRLTARDKVAAKAQAAHDTAVAKARVAHEQAVLAAQSAHDVALANSRYETALLGAQSRLAVAQTRAVQSQKKTDQTNAQATEKSRGSAVTKADSLVRQALQDATKTAAGGGIGAALFGGAAGGAKPAVGSEAYNRAVASAVARVTPLLSPYMGRDEIVRFVQQRTATSPLFKPAVRAAQSGPNFFGDPTGTVQNALGG